MGKVVAIGGGDIRKRSTAAIDKEIIRLSGKRHPCFLFIPTASSDYERYWDVIKKYYEQLGCKADVLFLIRQKPTHQEIRDKILKADIIYVGGGNTLMMMKLWKKRGVDVLLKQAHKKNVVLCGMSAGSICWFNSGHSDSMSFYHPKRWRYINVRGLGLIKGIHCPHFNGQTLWKKRRGDFQKMIKMVGGFGIAIDNDCAIEFVNGQYRVIASRESANAYKVFKRGGHVVVEKLLKTKNLASLSQLYLKT